MTAPPQHDRWRSALTLAISLAALSSFGCGTTPAASPPKTHPPAPPARLARLLVADVDWIAGGAMISFLASAGDDDALWLTRADGTHTIQVAGDGYGAFVSPTGMTVATAEYGNPDAVTAIILKRPDGRQLAKLRVPVPSDDADALYELESVSWSADEDSIVFNLVGESDTIVDTGAIFVADGKEVRLISDSTHATDFSPRWSVDGRWILFTHCRPNTDTCKPMKMRADGTERQPGEPGLVAGGFASPDGRWSAFARPVGPMVPFPGRISNARQKFGIYVARADGEALRRVATTAPMEYDTGNAPRPKIAWSADSTQFVFLDTRGIFLARLRDGSTRHLTSKGGYSPYPAEGDYVSEVSWAPAPRVMFIDHAAIYTLAPGGQPVRLHLRGS